MGTLAGVFITIYQLSRKHLRIFQTGEVKQVGKCLCDREKCRFLIVGSFVAILRPGQNICIACILFQNHFKEKKTLKADIESFTNAMKNNTSRLTASGSSSALRFVAVFSGLSCAELLRSASCERVFASAFTPPCFSKYSFPSCNQQSINLSRLEQFSNYGNINKRAAQKKVVALLQKVPILSSGLVQIKTKMTF